MWPGAQGLFNHHHHTNYLRSADLTHWELPSSTPSVYCQEGLVRISSTSCCQQSLRSANAIGNQWRIYIVKFWTRAPRGPNSFNFMQFLGKFGKIVCWRPPECWRPLLGEILDPPLAMVGLAPPTVVFTLTDTDRGTNKMDIITTISFLLQNGILFTLAIYGFSSAVADLHSKILDARPPWGSKFFQFHAVFGKFWQNRMLAPPPPGSWRPLLGEILDPPLSCLPRPLSPPQTAFTTQSQL